MNWKDIFRELTWRNVVKEFTIAFVMLVIFSVLFILAHLALRQELPRWY